MQVKTCLYIHSRVVMCLSFQTSGVLYFHYYPKFQPQKLNVLSILFQGFLMVGYATIYTMFPVFSLVLDKIGFQKPFWLEN
jgi:hypothetical protein